MYFLKFLFFALICAEEIYEVVLYEVVHEEWQLATYYGSFLFFNLFVLFYFIFLFFYSIIKPTQDRHYRFNFSQGVQIELQESSDVFLVATGLPGSVLPSPLVPNQINDVNSGQAQFFSDDGASPNFVDILTTWGSRSSDQYTRCTLF